MKNFLIDFASNDWEAHSQSMRFKSFVRGNQRVRLVEFSEGFEEKDWCTKGHAGYVLEGQFSIDFDGKRESFKAGDVFFIPEGPDFRHKAFLCQGEKVLLLLFEII